MSVDPVTADGNTGGNFNRYWYANNNPYRFTDPDGRRSKEELDHKREMAQASRGSITSKSPSSAAQMATSARSTGGGSSRQSSDGASKQGGTQHSAGGLSVTSVFTGDTKPTFTYSAAAGVGVKAEFKEGEDNDRYSITTPSLGVTAAGMWNAVTIGYDFMPVSNTSPADTAVNLGGRGGLGVVFGGAIKFTPPGKVEFSVNVGLGAAAQLEVYEVGVTPGKL